MNNYNLNILKKKDAKKAAKILADAFLDYPIVDKLIPNKKRRWITLYEIFKIELKYAIKNNYVYSLPDFSEVAIWKSDASLPNYFSYAFSFSLSSFKLLYSISGREFKELSILVNDINKTKSQLILPNKTAELFFIGVMPEKQGQGRAGKLIKPMLNKLEDEDYSCLVLTNTELNKSYYERFGFETIKSSYDNRFDIATYFMLKK